MVLIPHGRPNWPKMRAEYVEGIRGDNGQLTWPTLNEVAARAGCNGSWVRDRAGRERWVERREAFQRRVDEERQAARAAEMARLGADLDLRVLRSAAIGLGMVEARLDELGRMAADRMQAARQPGANLRTLPPAPDADLAKTLAQTVGYWYDLGNRALGDVPTSRVLVDAQANIQVTLTPDERDARTAAVLAVMMQAGDLPGDVLGNGHRHSDGNGSSAPVLDVGGRTLEAGSADDAPDDEVHPGEPDS